jgi:putative addiction module killer protein
MSAEFLDEAGRSPFGRWFGRLPPPAAAKVTTALYRLAEGNTSSVKSVGHGVHELRIDFGPGYRVYFGMDGATLIILLAGGSKSRQQQDIEQAWQHWGEYKRRKRTAR